MVGLSVFLMVGVAVGDGDGGIVVGKDVVTIVDEFVGTGVVVAFPEVVDEFVITVGNIVGTPVVIFVGEEVAATEGLLVGRKDGSGDDDDDDGLVVLVIVGGVVDDSSDDDES